MSIHDRAVVATLVKTAMMADGALLGLGVAYVAYCSIRKFSDTSSALGRIVQAPSVQTSDLRSIISGGTTSGKTDDGPSSSGDAGKLIIVRGTVSAADKGNWKNVRDANPIASRESGEKGVIVKQVQTCIYSELKGIFGWPADIRSLFSKCWKERESSTTRMVPFVLVGGGNQSDYLVVHMEGSKHPLPLTTVYSNLQPINVSPYTFLQALFGLEYPVGLLYEEKILPLEKEVTAVGLCSLRNGILEIKSCKDLPYFLCDLNKDQIITELSFKSRALMWSGLAFGALAVGILGYSITRNFIKWRQRKQSEEENESTRGPTPGQVVMDEEPGEVPEGQLCVVCLMRWRRSAFIPCGHLVCCQKCALEVERDISPMCPVCRQTIKSSVRIYDS